MNRKSEVFMVSENEQRKAIAIWEKVMRGEIAKKDIDDALPVIAIVSQILGQK